MTQSQETLYIAYHNCTDIKERYFIAKEIMKVNLKTPIPEYWRNLSLKDIPGEEWKQLDVNGLDKFIMASSYGRLKRIFRTIPYRGSIRSWPTTILKGAHIKQSDSLVSVINVDGVRHRSQIYRYTAAVFVPNPENKPCVNHIDGNRLNGHFLNLEWATHRENLLHSYHASGTKIPRKGTNHPDYKGLVGQYDKDGELIKVYESISSTQKFGFHRAQVGAVISGKRAHHRGFIWKLMPENEFISIEDCHKMSIEFAKYLKIEGDLKTIFKTFLAQNKIRHVTEKQD